MSDCDRTVGPCSCGAWHRAESTAPEAPIVGNPGGVDPTKITCNSNDVRCVNPPWLETDPTGVDAKTPGAKHDAGKIDVVRGALHYFPLALEAVAELSQLGAQKYSWGGWREVPDGRNRYTAALGRHLLKEQTEGLLDEEWAAKNIKVLHATAVAWNALARLELLREELK